ncbi:hypothetical protein HWV62_8495 [Athelia sp. TMB]|nr:hypothetical protein HWV62_8495 [Athelia sp. TMB]
MAPARNGRGIHLSGSSRYMKDFSDHHLKQKTTRPSQGSKPSETSKRLSQSGIRKEKEKAAEYDHRQKQRMSERELARQEQLIASNEASMNQDSEFNTYYEEILQGSQPVEISHAGGEMDALAAASVPHPRCEFFLDQVLPSLIGVGRYTGENEGWTIEHADHGSAPKTSRDENVEDEAASVKILSIRVADMYATNTLDVMYPSTDPSPCPALVSKGILPTAPSTPTFGFSIKTMELYRTAQFRCPQFSVQAFVRTIADLHQEAWGKWRIRQFSFAYDLYLAIRAGVDARVKKALNRDDPNWNLQHVCPPCMYRLAGEDELVFSMLWVMDGNDSLKRFERRAAVEEEGPSLGLLVERIDTRKVPAGSMYITREEVDVWATKPGSKNRDPEEDNEVVCCDRWKNMKPEATAHMYRTGEQSKYGLATECRMMHAHGKDQGSAIDIGCSLRQTLNNSPLGELARELNHSVLVDAFHGNAHNWLCQLENLTTYVTGVGLEKLGACEQSFSLSNKLAAPTRSMSTFHRRQAINEYFRNTDDYETYQNMTSYIKGRYSQALNILADGPKALELEKTKLGISGQEGIFEQWLQEEKTYLQSLSQEPPQETLQMEYYQRLTHLWQCETLAAGVLSVVFYTTDPTAATIVQSLELRLGIQERWTREMSAFQETRRMVAMREYQRALDSLEGLVVARIFELTRMNRAGMGYKMRKHIGKALQARSVAIRTALERYNTAARALDPPREMLRQEDIFEYAFLSEFDLLRDTRQDIRERPWSTPAGRRAMDLYFSILRAREEVQRCNIEIKRIATHLRDEALFLQHHQNRLRANSPLLAHQIFIYQNVRGRFASHTRQRLASIAKLKGFSGDLTPGESISTGPGTWGSLSLSTTLDSVPVSTHGEDIAPSAEEAVLEAEEEDDETELQEQEDEVDILTVVTDRVGGAQVDP